MSSFSETRVDLVEFVDTLKHPNLPLIIDDMTLAHTLGIRNKTLWWLVLNNTNMYDVFSIPKRNRAGGKRYIQNPGSRLKTVQRLILARILEPVPVGKHIGAYIPGRSCMHTATQHLKSSVIISLDIKDFFPSVRRAMVRNYLKTLGYNHLVSSLLADLMTYKNSVPPVTYKNFVPQGAPTSGLIANLIADRAFDQKILASLKELDPGWRYTRYSDDIDISHPDDQPQERIQEIIALVEKYIQSGGFRLNTRKTKVDPRWKRQKVLGIVVNEKPNIPRLEYMRLRCLIHNCLTHGFQSQFERAGQKSANSLKAHIRGKLSFLKQIDEVKASRLKRKFEIAEEIHSGSSEEEVSFA